MRRPQIRSYHEADTWLQGGKDKSKQKRTLYEGYKKSYLLRTSLDTITVMNYGTPLVTYFKNGEYMLFGARHMWQGQRYSLMKYAPVQVVTRNHRVILSTNADGRTPPKIQTCRKCSGFGKVEQPCYGVGICYEPDCADNIEANRLVNEEDLNWWDPQVTKLRHTAGKHGNKCSHGFESAHVIPLANQCWSCQGAGKRDYGSKKQGRVWNGTAIRIDKDGNYLGWDQNVHGA